MEERQIERDRHRERRNERERESKQDSDRYDGQADSEWQKTLQSKNKTCITKHEILLSERRGVCQE